MDHAPGIQRSGRALEDEYLRQPLRPRKDGKHQLDYAACANRPVRSRPIRLSNRFSIGGCVENRFPTASIAFSGSTMNRLLYAGLASIGIRFEYISSFSSAEARSIGSPASRAPSASA